MTPPDDRSGQYGVPYPGTGHDAFGAPGTGYAEDPYGRSGTPGGPGPYSSRSAPGQGDALDYGQPYGRSEYGQDYAYGEGFDQQADYGNGWGGDPEAWRGGPDDGRGAEESRDGAPQEGARPDDTQDDGPLIRPFAITGGRTRPRYELALEALVSSTADPGRLPTLLPEHQRICTLCTEIKSVAEVSALLSMPLGVARILVADLAEAGLVAIHQPAAGGESGGQPDVTLLERVLSGLRKL